MKKRLLCLLLSLAMLLPLMLQAVPSAEAASKQTPKRAISIVLDNSGSMYMDHNATGWCRATYAMEVFAAMMNEGDTLRIYPMHNITEGKTAATDVSDPPGSTEPWVINGPKDSQRIRKLFTPVASGTPFDPVPKAYEDLKKIKADEKYLIILTDGAFDGQPSGAEVSKRLDAYIADMQVMFLGIGIEDAYKPTESDLSRQYYAFPNSSEGVLTELTAMCNRIFGRNTLPEKYVKNNKIEFDVSVSKLIVFIQGENINNIKLDGKTGTSSTTTHYSTEGGAYAWSNKADYNAPADVDTDLQGMMVTFEQPFDAGSYSLEYSGDDSSISVYYEPDVDLQVRFESDTGEVVDPAKDELYAGTYRLTYCMVDKYGNPTDSELLGEVKYTITYTIDGQEYPVETSSGSGSVPVELTAGQKLDSEFTVDYLDGYSIRKTGWDLGWPEGGIEIGTRPAGDTRLVVEGGQRRYNLSELEEKAVYHVSVIYEGNKVTGEGKKAVTFAAPELEGGNAKVEVQEVDDGWNVSLKYNGDAASTQCGNQALTFNASYTNEDGQTANAAPIREEFEIADDSQALKLRLILNQKYYVMSDLENGEPILVELTAAGDYLSADVLDAAKVTVKIGNKTVNATKAENGVGYVVAATELAGFEAGKYDVYAHVDGVDTLGHPATDDDTAKLELQSYPEWLRWLVIFLIIALLIALILIIMYIPRLPNDAKLTSDTYFSVGGKKVEDGSIRYNGKGKKKGNITVESPNFPLNNNAVSGFTLDLVAKDYLKDPSARRGAWIVGMKAFDSSNTLDLTIDGDTYVPNDNGEMVSATDPEAPVKIPVQGTTNFTIRSKAPRTTGNGTVTCTLTGNIEFL